MTTLHAQYMCVYRPTDAHVVIYIEKERNVISRYIDLRAKKRQTNNCNI